MFMIMIMKTATVIITKMIILDIIMLVSNKSNYNTRTTMIIVDY